MSTEKVLVNAIQRAIESKHPGAWVFKVVGNPYQRVGVPDLLVCVRGLLIGLEVKLQRPGESLEHALDRATPGQLHELERIAEAGGAGAVVTSAESALSVIELALRKSSRR